MSEPAIIVNGLGKVYRIGHAPERYPTFRDAIMHGLGAPLRRLRTLGRHATGDDEDTFWALKDVSFEVQPGEVVGIIGRNGAGKSTVLKILSRITDPTTGEVILNGRVASLLEVGTGFHPELTGRENIYLNGAILGMKRVEIDRKFDEIVAFAEIEKFLDTPVKRYSSGMYVRLAFAVAAHLEPEILIVDEVLAVGDAEFQRKCLGKMQQVSRGEGRTVLFVSHNMATVRSLCGRALLLTTGQVACDGEPSIAIDRYIGRAFSDGESFEARDVAASRAGVLDSVRLLRVDGEPAARLTMDEAFDVEITYRLHQLQRNVHVMLFVYRDDAVLVFGSATWDALGLGGAEICPAGSYRARCRVPGHLLNFGRHFISVNVQTPGREYLLEADRVLSFEVTEFGGAGGAKSAKRPGACRPFLEWQVTRPREAGGGG